VAKRIILNSAVTETQWQTSFSILPVIRMLSCKDQHRWRELAIFFIYHKSFTGAGGDRIHSAAYSTAGLFSHTQSKRPSAAMPRHLDRCTYYHTGRSPFLKNRKLLNTCTVMFIPG